MITCAIVDDEPRNISILTKLLTRYCPEVKLTGVATSSGAAIELINKEQPQLVFLDVEMPDMDAFELLSELKPFNFEYILVTAFDRYAVKAFANNALHYLLKPVDIDELRLAVQKASARIMETNVSRQIDDLKSHTANNQLIKIALPTLNGLVFYSIDEIVCCSASNTYTLFEFVKDKDLLVTGTLKEFEEKLPASIFCRVHNSHLINMNHIRQYIKGKGGQVKMINGKVIDVSLRKRDEFLSRLR
jgi:two-component system, LytTR family, response regulator